MDALIESFREKLAQSPEFQRALVHNYLYGQGSLEDVEFQRGDYDYSVYLGGVSEETDGERDTSVHRGVGPYAGWKTLRVERSPKSDYDEDYGYDEILEMHIAPGESEYDKTATRYHNYNAEVHQTNTHHALEKAKELIDNF